MIIQGDSLEKLKGMKDKYVDVIFSDPPYGLGSELIIRPDGKPDYEKAADFMGKWDMPTGDFWEKWFVESYRVLKYGGYCLMFGMDRQLLLFKYYAHKAGFSEHQSLYWYFISNFPKATDLSNIIKKHAQKGVIIAEERGAVGGGAFGEAREERLTLPTSELAKKYEGYKYSIAPIKQTNETIMVFHKPYKTGSCLHDTLAYENGDKECCCGALDIDGNRVPTNENLAKNYNSIRKSDDEMGERVGKMGFRQGKDSECEAPESLSLGRYPAQTFIDNEVAEVLDKQSGDLTSGSLLAHHKMNESENISMSGKNYERTTRQEYISSSGGCSKILHKCNYDTDDFDIYYYCPKVSKKERNAGLDNMEDLEFKSDNPTKNNHPTVKPISLITKVLSLFKTPNPQVILFPFAGVGSEVIGGIKAGFTNWLGVEVNPEYIEIANARIKYHSEQAQNDLFME